MIYLDHHASTPVLPEVWEAMRPLLIENFGNPSSSHAFGRKARRALEDARERVASLLDAFPDEVIFTSGATEANNLALFGLAGEPPGHLLASPIEHPCVIEPLKQLAAQGFEVDWLSVSNNGFVAAPDLANRMRPDTRLATLMLVNHETGAIQPVAEAVRRIAPTLFHTDSSQAVGKIPVRFHELAVSTLSASGHKFGVPKGVGLLLLRRDLKLRPLFFGGHQQQGRRPGTEPVAFAVGLAIALEIAHDRLSQNLERVRQLRSRFLDRLRAEAAPIVVNSSELSSPYVANVSFSGLRADVLLMKLDLAGIACSTGSACSSGSLLPSPTLQAMGVADEVLRSAMRFSFCARLSESDIDEAATRITKCINDLRRKRE